MYKLSLCYTPIKPDLLNFPGIGIFACGLLDRVFKRFVSPFIEGQHNLDYFQN
jgi:hypothetical protein